MIGFSRPSGGAERSGTCIIAAAQWGKRFNLERFVTPALSVDAGRRQGQGCSTLGVNANAVSFNAIIEVASSSVIHACFRGNRDKARMTRRGGWRCQRRGHLRRQGEGVRRDRGCVGRGVPVELLEASKKTSFIIICVILLILSLCII